MTTIRSTDPSMIEDRRLNRVAADEGGPRRHGNIGGSKGRGSALWGARPEMKRNTPKPKIRQTAR